MEANIRLLGNVKIIDFSGSLDWSNASQVRQVIFDATADQQSHVVVNLRDVNFLDSSGLSALVQGVKRAREHQGDLSLCGLRPQVRMIFELTRLDRVFEIYISEEDAVLAAASLY